MFCINLYSSYEVSDNQVIMTEVGKQLSVLQELLKRLNFKFKLNLKAGYDPTCLNGEFKVT